MFDFLKRNKNETTSSKPAENEHQTQAGLFARLKKGLSKTRHAFSEKIAALFLGKKN